VCRSWRVTLRDNSLWTALDMSTASGLKRKTDATLRGASARAGGHLETLDVRGCQRVSFQALLAAATANGGALREMRICGWGMLALENAAALLRAAPLLRVCDANVHCTAEDQLARAMLRNEPPFGPLRVHALSVAGLDAGKAAALAAALADHSSLTDLELFRARLDAATALDAVVDAVWRRVSIFRLQSCVATASAAPALARLLGGAALTNLTVRRYNASAGPPLLDAPAAALLGAALRANTTLTALTLGSVRLWHDPAAAAVLLGALTGHPSIQSLNLSVNFAEGIVADRDAAPAFAALGALVAADAPALHTLDLSFCRLGDAGLGPLVDALPHNTHLRTLDCQQNDTSAAFTRHRLLPAVAANASLRELHAGPEAADAEALVAARGAA
jgi:hypothetical protein